MCWGREPAVTVAVPGAPHGHPACTVAAVAVAVPGASHAGHPACTVVCRRRSASSHVRPAARPSAVAAPLSTPTSCRTPPTASEQCVPRALLRCRPSFRLESAHVPTCAYHAVLGCPVFVSPHAGCYRGLHVPPPVRRPLPPCGVTRRASPSPRYPGEFDLTLRSAGAGRRRLLWSRVMSTSSARHGDWRLPPCGQTSRSPSTTSPATMTTPGTAPAHDPQAPVRLFSPKGRGSSWLGTAPARRPETFHRAGGLWLSDELAGRRRSRSSSATTRSRA